MIGDALSERMLKNFRRALPLLLLMCGLGMALTDRYQIDGDAVSFTDSARAIVHGNFGMAVNGMWAPGYPFLLAIGRWIGRPTILNELQNDYLVNWAIFGLALLAMHHLVRSILQMRDEMVGGRRFAFGYDGAQIVGYLAVFYCWQREQSVGKIRSDALLAVCLMFAASFALRLFRTNGWLNAAGLGFALGYAYLTKAFGLVAGCVLLGLLAGALLVRHRFRGGWASRWALAAVIFSAVAGPYIHALSKQRGRFDFGDAGTINYSWFIDGARGIHQAYFPPARATLKLKHPERRLMVSPAIYAYDQHLVGTLPSWFDVGYFYDQTITHFYLPAQIRVIKVSAGQLLRYVMYHAELPAFALMLLLLGFRLRFAPLRSALGVLPVWGVFIIAMYALVLVVDRYLTAGYLVFWLPLLLLFEAPEREEDSRRQALAFVMAGIAVAAVLSNVRETLLTRRDLSIQANNKGGRARGAYHPGVYTAVAELGQMGLKPGDRVACAGFWACAEPYWAYLSQAQMVALVNDDDHDQPLPIDSNVEAALRSVNARVLVTCLPAGTPVPPGWKHIGVGDYYAYAL